MRDGRARAGDYVTLLLVAAVAWAMLLAGSDAGASGSHTHAADSARGMTSWFVMLVAMMTPALIEPVRHIRRRTFRARHWRSLAIFAAGYAAVWMAAGVVLMTAADAVTASAFPTTAAIAVATVAAVWQCAPIKQRCLNRCHAMSDLPAFGADADLAALRFGVTHGVWCTGSCWAIMLWVAVLPAAHLAGMACATFVIAAERLDTPRPVRWQLRVPDRAPRLAWVHTTRRYSRP